VKIFLDTANIEHIREAASLGVVDGVTTNPTLISREEGEFEDIVRQICEIVDGPVSAEVVSLECAGMVEEAKKLVQIHENVVIKIPMTEEGMKSVKSLTQDGIRTNVTLVFSANQALLEIIPFETFLDRPDTFSLGVCNGCQLLALLGWVPWRGLAGGPQPRFVRTASGRFESRFATATILKSPAIMFR